MIEERITSQAGVAGQAKEELHPIVPPGLEITPNSQPPAQASVGGPLVLTGSEGEGKEEKEKEDGEKDEHFGSNREFIKHRVKHRAAEWLRETAAGILTSLAVVIFTLVLVQLGLVSQGQEFSFALFSPYEFWQSFSGLVVTWSQWNEWLLLSLGLLALAADLAVLWHWRSWQRRHALDKKETEAKKPALHRLEGTLHSMKTVGAAGMIAALFLAAYGYQQYLWRVQLPVPADKIGIAFTRQVGSTVAEDKLADSLRQDGHENQIVMRDLPVSFDARDTQQAQAMGRRIGAEAVVIYREEGTPGGGTANTAPPGKVGLANPLTQAQTTITTGATATTNAGMPSTNAGSAHHYVAYLVFADPQLGVQIPVPQRDAQGNINGLSYRSKDGADVPRLETTDLDRLMELAAGILLYDKNHYLAALSHFKNAARANGSGDTATDALVDYYLGSAYYLINQDGEAATAFDSAIQNYAKAPQLDIQSRLLYANALTTRAGIYFNAGDVESTQRLLDQAIALRKAISPDDMALNDPATFRRVHSTFGTAYIGRMQVEQGKPQADPEAVTYWAGQAKTEALLLSSKQDDNYALAASIWMTYRTGSCSAAYQQAQDIVLKDPNNVRAHQLLEQIAFARDGSLGSAEVQQQLAALLAIDPSSLPDLEMSLSYYSLQIAFADPAYIKDLESTVQSILKVDPYNAAALQDYAQQAYFDTAAQLSGVPNGTWDVGDQRTYAAIRTRWAGDAAQVKAALSRIDAARPLITKWKEEVQPGTFLPLYYYALLSGNAENDLYNYLYIYGGKDPDLAKQYAAADKRAMQDIQASLDPSVSATPYQTVQARKLIEQLWLHRYNAASDSKDMKSAGRDIEELLAEGTHIEQTLVANAPTGTDNLYIAAAAYLSLFIDTRSAVSYYTSVGDTAQAAQYTTLANGYLSKWQDLSQQEQKSDQANSVQKGITGCSDGALKMGAASVAAKEGNHTAADNLKRYIASYPQDPEGYAELGWIQYLDGDYTGALSSTEQASKLDPGLLSALSNRPTILSAEGKSSEAQDAEKSFTKATSEKPPAAQLRALNEQAFDLFEAARNHPQSRSATDALLTELEGYLEGLSKSTQDNYSSNFLRVLTTVTAGFAWAGDYPAARHATQRAIAINAQLPLLQINLAFVDVASGDQSSAQAHIDQAIKLADATLKDERGKDLTKYDLQTAALPAQQDMQLAAGAFQELQKQRPDLASAIAPLLTEVQKAISRYEALTK